MKFINSWKSYNKDSNRVHLNFRVGRMTYFKFYWDVSDKEFRFKFFNFGIGN